MGHSSRICTGRKKSCNRLTIADLLIPKNLPAREFPVGRASSPSCAAGATPAVLGCGRHGAQAIDCDEKRPSSEILAAQLLKQRLGFLQIHSIEAFSEPVVDLSERPS